MKCASSEQLVLPMSGISGWPFPVLPRAIARAARGAFFAHPDSRRAERARNWFACRRYLEAVALLRTMRARYRKRLSAARKAGQVASAAAFACTAEGRRTHRAIEALSLRIAKEQAALCG